MHFAFDYLKKIGFVIWVLEGSGELISRTQKLVGGRTLGKDKVLMEGDCGCHPILDDDNVAAFEVRTKYDITKNFSKKWIMN